MFSEFCCLKVFSFYYLALQLWHLQAWFTYHSMGNSCAQTFWSCSFCPIRCGNVRKHGKTPFLATFACTHFEKSPSLYYGPENCSLWFNNCPPVFSMDRQRQFLNFPIQPPGNFCARTGRLRTYFVRCSNYREVSSRTKVLTPPDRVTSIPVEKNSNFPHVSRERPPQRGGPKIPTIQR